MSRGCLWTGRARCVDAPKEVNGHVEAHLVGGGACRQPAHDARVDAGARGIFARLADGTAADVAEQLARDILDPCGVVAPFGGKEGEAVLRYDVTEVCRPDRAVIGRKRSQIPSSPPHRTRCRDEACRPRRADGDDEGRLDVPHVLRDDETGISQGLQGAFELVVGIALDVHPTLGLEPLDELSQPGVALALQIVVVGARQLDVTTGEEASIGSAEEAEQVRARKMQEAELVLPRLLDIVLTTSEDERHNIP